MGKLTREDLEKLEQEARDLPPPKNWIKVGVSTCGIAAGAEVVYQRLESEIAARKLDVSLLRTGCVGMCHAEPLVEVCTDRAPRTMYGGITSDDVPRLLDEHITAGRVLTAKRVPGVEDLGYLGEGNGHGPQVRIVLRNCGVIDPTRVEDYLGRGGYQGLRRALFELGAEGVIEELKASGLRGRGGAGYPTWLKWKFLHEAQADEKFIICNGDEGDPGAYMDRSVLEGDPHSVIEGMLIGAFATGCSQGYLYIRAEYPLAVERIETAIRQARRLGLVGNGIMGSVFNCDLEVRLGAGAFVCGEETALMASIEGRRGTPRPRPPFPAQSGLWHKPSNINNVETLANIAPIVQRGGSWYAQFGSGKSRGTKVFAVTGKVRNSGLVEIPMGTTIRDVVMNIGGGVEEGRTVKAVQTGGPSGGVIPIEHFDTPITYESLIELGSIMGSGGMIVMDDTDDMVDIARFYVGFCVEESCGKCAPCRVGGKQMLMLLDKIAEGRGGPGDIALLRRISHAMQKASLCGLGQTAPNPVLSTLRYFESEYTELINA